MSEALLPLLAATCAPDALLLSNALLDRFELSVIDRLELSMLVIERFELSMAVVERFELSLVFVDRLELSVAMFDRLELSVAMFDRSEVSVLMLFVDRLELSVAMFDRSELSVLVVDRLELSTLLIDRFDPSVFVVVELSMFVDLFELSVICELSGLNDALTTSPPAAWPLLVVVVDPAGVVVWAWLGATQAKAVTDAARKRRDCMDGIPCWPASRRHLKRARQSWRPSLP